MNGYEYFDANGKGHAGVNVNEKSAAVGLAGEGQRVVKRKIILKGIVSTGGNQKKPEQEKPASETPPSLQSPEALGLENKTPAREHVEKISNDEDEARKSAS